MSNVNQNNTVKLILAVILTGCASHPAEQSAGTTSRSTQIITQPIADPIIQPVRPYPGNYATEPNNQNYFASTLTGTYGDSLAVRDFIRHMVKKHRFSETYLNGLFSRANRLESVIRLESPEPYTGPAKPRLGSWTRYRNKFLTEAHINNGVAFWRNNADAVERASATYGVDPEYIVAIIGVETYFGKNIGKTCVLDALTTLAFDTHRRAKFFTLELENFLLMAREQGYEPRQPVGSWAGAMGLGQFMPSSYRRLAVDFDNNGRCDIWQPGDAIGSVAHYFSRSGWQLNSPVAKPTSPAKDSAVIELSTYSGNEYWLVQPNFKVIKKYNNSNKYAMAVHQLAQAIKQRYY
ncbi:MAG: lytic murein transglycosylase [Methylovulum sp.]|nr:lytic murein transglycosylase [Methylovulum sp.]